MAEVIHIRELQAARDRARRRNADHQYLERAVAIIRDNLAEVVEQMRAASDAEQPELLDRAENLVAMIRYSMRMLARDESENATG